MDVQRQIADLSAPGAAAVGLVVDSVTVSAAGKRTHVLVTVDLPETEIGSADLDTVAKASRAIGQALDDANVPATPYVLEVSTPGTDRALTERRHFMRARTRLVALEMVSGEKRSGRLSDVMADTLVLDVDGEKKRVLISEVARGTIIVELKQDN